MSPTNNYRFRLKRVGRVMWAVEVERCWVYDDKPYWRAAFPETRCFTEQGARRWALRQIRRIRRIHEYEASEWTVVAPAEQFVSEEKA